MANFIPKITYTELGTGTPKSVNFIDTPEGDPLGEQTQYEARDTRALDGTKQTQFRYALKKYNLRFLFETKTTLDAFNDFLDNHAARGGSFNYFIHNDEAGFEVFEFVQNSFKIDRRLPDGSGDFLYNFQFQIERVK